MLKVMPTVPPSDRPGRKRDPHTDIAAVEAVLDLVSTGLTLSGLSLVVIAEHAGVSRNSLYRRWKTKDDLYLDVLASINRPLPDSEGPSARSDLVEQLARLVERTLDVRSSAMLRAMSAEAHTFPVLHRRYFEEIVTPRREAVYRIIRRGIASGELRPDIDVAFVNELLVGPVLARLASGDIKGLHPRKTPQRIVDLLYDGIETR
jgi:AcrR family transcriptional regulator